MWLYSIVFVIHALCHIKDEKIQNGGKKNIADRHIEHNPNAYWYAAHTNKV